MNLGQEVQGFSDDYWCPAETAEGASASPSDPLLDGALWVALLKMSNGDAIAPAEHEWLVAQNLVEVVDGAAALTARGRTALGV